MRMSRLGLIIEALDAVDRTEQGGLTLKELQDILTKRRVQEGITKAIIRLVLRSPFTIFRLFRKIPQRRIVKDLLTHYEYGRIVMDEKSEKYAEISKDNPAELAKIFLIRQTVFSLSEKGRKESVKFWGYRRLMMHAKKAHGM